MGKFFRRFVAFWSLLADTLQVVGFEWAKFAIFPLVAAGFTGLIGVLQGASWLAITVAIPVVVAACLLIAALIRVWPFLRRSAAIRGVHPSLALGLFTDEDLRRRRDDFVEKQHQIWARLSIAKMQLARMARARVVDDQHRKEEAKVQEALEELDEKKQWADIEADVAERALLGDFYGKLQEGALVASGLVEPHVHGAAAVDIPAVEWAFLRCDDSMEFARGGGISYRVVSIRKSIA